MLGADPAKAVININLFDDGSDLKIVVSGSLSELGTSDGPSSCGVNGAIVLNVVCTGIDVESPTFLITGPSGFGGTANLIGADSSSGPFFAFAANEIYAIDPSYTVGQPLLSSATFNGTNLAAQGFTTPGLAYTWTINGTSESINLFIGPPAEVPGPLPLLGAGAAFGWSRRLRRRISTPGITPPQV